MTAIRLRREWASPRLGETSAVRARMPPSPRLSARRIKIRYLIEITINSDPVQLNELEDRLRTIFEERREKTMFIMGAGTLRYGEIITVIDAAKGAGVEKVGIVTERMRGAAGG